MTSNSNTFDSQAKGDGCVRRRIGNWPTDGALDWRQPREPSNEPPSMLYVIIPRRHGHINSSIHITN